MSNFYENEYDSLPLRETESSACLCRGMGMSACLHMCKPLSAYQCSEMSMIAKMKFSLPLCGNVFVSLPELLNEYDSLPLRENETQPASAEEWVCQPASTWECLCQPTSSLNWV